MEKGKIKKPRTVKIQYPAPYTQSWANAMPKINNMAAPKSAMGWMTNQKIVYNPCPRMMHNRMSTGWLQPPRPDPTAPHLKYGVFPKKQSLIRGHSHEFSNKRNVPAEITSSKNKQQGHLSQPPLLVFRPLDKRNTRHLTKSAIMHLDIKPRRNLPMSPGRRVSSPSPVREMRDRY